MHLKLTSFLFAVMLLLPGFASAGSLCDAECQITIEFPNGGWIRATESVTITFGDPGLIDTVGSVTAYVDGESLVLNQGDRLDFGSGGRFVIGRGNIDFTALEIITSGEARIIAQGGSETLQIASGSVLSVFGGADLIFKALVVSLNGSLQLSPRGQLGLYNDLARGCGITAHATDAVDISQVTVSVTADNSACGRLLNLATVNVIPDGAGPADNNSADDDEAKDATAIAPCLMAWFTALLIASIVRRHS